MAPRYQAKKILGVYKTWGEYLSNFLLSSIKSFEVHGVSDCPWNLRSLALLMDKGYPYSYVNYDFNFSLLKEILQANNFQTVPLIYVILDGESEEKRLIGGYSELKKLILGAQNE